MTTTIETQAGIAQERLIRTAIPGPKSQAMHARRAEVVSTGVGAALPIAAMLGFNPQEIGPDTTFGGIKFVAVVLPSIIALPAVFLLFNYPIDEKRHAEIRRELQERGIQT
jgi:hypothetical protein